MCVCVCVCMYICVYIYVYILYIYMLNKHGVSFRKQRITCKNLNVFQL